MRSLNRRIVLINLSIDQRPIDWIQLELNEKEAFIFDPVKLFIQTDWTKFEDCVELINIVYQGLFDAVVIENKSLICYWPILNSPDDLWFELLNQCKSSGIQPEVNYNKDKVPSGKNILPEFQRLWKSFILFMMETLWEDIQLNEGFEEIVCLRNPNESILLFRVEEKVEPKYSYLLSADAMFEFEPSLEFQKKGDVHNVPLFTSFKHLMKNLQEEIDLTNYNATFINRDMGRGFLSSIMKKCNSNNLIKNWIEYYSEN